MSKKSKGGRPTKYKAEYGEQVFKLCLLGATDEQLADFFGVVVQTIHNWAEKHPAFLEARRRGKLEADANVAHSLYQRALGYSHPEEKIFHEKGRVTRADTTKHYPPDTAAAFIWLKNRAGWRDKVDHSHSGEVSGIMVVPAEVAATEWAAKAREQQRELERQASADVAQALPHLAADGRAG